MCHFERNDSGVRNLVFLTKHILSNKMQDLSFRPDNYRDYIQDDIGY